MSENTRIRMYVQAPVVGLGLLAVCCFTIASCGFPERQARRADTELEPGWPKPNDEFHAARLPIVKAEMPTVEGAEYVNDDELCLTCHEEYTKTFAENVHRGIHDEGQACESCHGPASQHLITRGEDPDSILSFKTLEPAKASELCLQCHEEDACAPGARWRCSVHANNRVSCRDCHTSHYNVPPGTKPTTEPIAAAAGVHGEQIALAAHRQPADMPSLAGTSNNLGAVSPDTCYKCHGDMYEMQEIAGPHQIGGPNGFNCTTCHDAHGKILDHSRKDLCLECHQEGSPTMAWHASTHNLMGVACTDCHNPHPRAAVQQFPRATGVSFLHTNVARPKRLAMSVQEPEACYKCHAKIYGMNALPSHHPIKEGKMVCSDCHDAHGQQEGNLNADTKNLLCWKCHADKQGPFAYEHPPVTEDCSICHEPHGTVADNLLKQPPTFLCLRCHVGHRDGNHGHGERVDIDNIPQLRPALYTDCTTCHSQIHGSDLPTPHFPAMFR
ncbi:MAG: cytochrome c3 family protein [Planctomycetota bacterium]